jgi:CheY-like chemotaxis protein
MLRPPILIAEDDADDRFLLQTAFVENGYTDTIDFVENGVDVMNYLHDLSESANSPDHNGSARVAYPCFILLDLNMPKKNGREVLKEIKEHPDLKKIPVIIFTTTKNELEINRCYELGANSYIVKPSSFELLLKIINQIRNYWLMTSAIPV